MRYFNSADLIVPRCGISEAFANHRKPRMRWLSSDEAAEAGAHARGRLFFGGGDGEDDNEWGARKQARIVRGRQSTRNAWPWQVLSG